MLLHKCRGWDGQLWLTSIFAPAAQASNSDDLDQSAVAIPGLRGIDCDAAALAASYSGRVAGRPLAAVACAGDGFGDIWRVRHRGSLARGVESHDFCAACMTHRRMREQVFHIMHCLLMRQPP